MKRGTVKGKNLDNKRLIVSMFRVCSTLIEFITLLRLKSVRKIFILGTPEHDNMGDHAIAIAERKWIEDNYPECKILEFTENKLTTDFNLRLRLLPFIASPYDIVFMLGGGNLGDRYLYIERLRRNIISFFKKTRIIMFPQSIYFSDCPGQREKKITISIYNKHPDLTLLLRDQTSHNFAISMFPKCRVMLVPDIVTYLEDQYFETYERKGILFCIRSDIEAYFSQAESRELEKVLKQNHEQVEWKDTCIGRNILPLERGGLLDELLSVFMRHKVVVTDRFHGLIFSVITGTPCVVLRSLDHKIIDGFKWFENLNYVFYADDILKACDLVDKAMKIHEIDKPNFKEKYFNSLKEILS